MKRSQLSQQKRQSDKLADDLQHVKPRPERETILLVENDDYVMDVIQQMLTHQGYTVLTAKSGLEGLETFKRHAQTIDLIIADGGPPQHDGVNMCREIARISPKARVFLISGCHTRDQISASGIFVGFLHKPFELATLSAALREALDRPPALE